LPTPLQRLPGSHDEARTLRASLSLVISASLFGLMVVSVRALAGRVPAPQVAAVRFAMGIVAVIVAQRLGRAVLRPRRWRWLVVRGLSGGLAVVAFFLSIQHAGVGMGTLLNNTSPVWSLLFSWTLLHERPRATAFAALGLTLTGVFLVVGRAGSLSVGWWHLVGALSGIASGLSVTSIRAVRRALPGAGPAESSWAVFASFTTLGFLATLPWVIGRWVPPTPLDWLILLGVGGISIVGQLLLTRALEHVTATGSGIILQLTVAIAMLVGVTVFDEPMNARSALGTVLTISGVLWVVFSASSPPIAARRVEAT
jgi:drug/metabolite transporter (DMT)-like permease